MTATGKGGATSATTAPTAVVVPSSAAAGRLPRKPDGRRRGVAGNLQTDDSRATVTWQPGAVPVGKTVSLTTFASSLGLPEAGRWRCRCPGLSSAGFEVAARSQLCGRLRRAGRCWATRRTERSTRASPHGSSPAQLPRRNGSWLVRRLEQPDPRTDADAVPDRALQAGRLGRSHVHRPQRADADDADRHSRRHRIRPTTRFS